MMVPVSTENLIRVSPTYALIAPAPLASDIEASRLGDSHNGHHATLDRVAYHEVGGVRYAAGHVQREHDDSFLAYLADSPGDLSAHQRPGQNQRHRPRQAGHGSCRTGQFL